MKDLATHITLVLLMAVAVMGGECTSNDLTPLLETGIGCIKAANLDMQSLLNQDPSVLSKMCKHSECTSFFSKSTTLNCTVQGQPASLAAQACSLVVHHTLGTFALLVSLIREGRFMADEPAATKYVVTPKEKIPSRSRLMLSRAQGNHESSSNLLATRFRNSVLGIMTLRGAIKVLLKRELVRRSKKDEEFQTISLGFLRKSNPFRRACILFVSWVWFDRFITFSVLVNTIFLGFVDYSDPWAEGPNPTKPLNYMIDLANSISSWIFTAESVFKIIAQGFLWGPQSYLSEGWNRLDFLIVLSGLLSNFLGTARVGSIRVLRVLRPLRTLHSLPGLKVLTTALLASLPALGNVAILLAFIYMLFAILGMEIWRGSFSYRCRITPYPVALNFDASNAPTNNSYPPDTTYLRTILENVSAFPCLNISGQIMALGDTWLTPLNCFWPVDPLETTPVLCSPTSTAGRQCPRNLTCGSNFDKYGNPRFSEVIFNGAVQFSIAQYDTFNSNLNFGYTTFDNVWSAFVVILQTVTASGWMVLTQMTQQAGGYLGAALYFNGLLFLGMCFMLQLNMAVLYSEFVKAKEEQSRLANTKRRRSAVSNFIHAATMKHFQMAMSSYSSHMNPTTRKRIKRIRRWVRHLVLSIWFHRMGLAVTALNIITLASDHHPMDPTFSYHAQMLNFVFMLYFVIECCLKIFGLGFREYSIDRFNRFDLFTVLLGTIEILFSPPTLLSGRKRGASASVFTALRAARAIKLARAWQSLHKLLLAIGGALGEILNFLFFLILFLFVTSLLGMELFATKFQFDLNNYPVPFNNTNPTSRLHRSNFDSIQWAFFTVFQVLTYDNFPSILYDAWMVRGWIAPLYISFIIVIGVWIVMNMFSAILVESVLVDVDYTTPQYDSNDETSSCMDETIKVPEKQKPRLSRMVSSFTKSTRIRALHRAFRRFFHAANDKHRLSMQLPAPIPVIRGNSLGIFKPENLLRRICMKLLNRREYTWIITTAIATSCIFTAFDSPLIDRSVGIGLVLERSNTVFAILFAIEMFVIVVAKGLLWGHDSYIQDPWRILDGFIVIVSIIPLFVDNVGALVGLRALRTCRALRPLRVINKMPQLKVVVNVLFKCIPDIGRTLLFFFFMLFMFGIMSVMLFKGATYSCSISPYTYGLGNGKPPVPPWFPSNYGGDYQTNLSDDDVMTYPKSWNTMSLDIQETLMPVWNTSSCGPFSDDYVPTSKEICLCFAETSGTAWESQVPQRFDNIFLSVGSLYELTTMEGWSAVAIATIDSVGPDMQPIVNYRPVFMIYWWIFIIICAFFTTNLFIGVLCESFVRENYGVLVTDEQVHWIKMQRKVMALSPQMIHPRPRIPWRRWCHGIVHGKHFEPVMTAATLFNTAIMAAQTYGESAAVLSALENCYIAVSTLFVVEMLLKWGAWGLSYFRESWNYIECSIVVFTWISIGLTVIGGVDLGLVGTFIRVVRVLRTLRLIRQTKSLKSLFDTLTVSLPAVANVTALLFLFYYIYAAVAVQLFATVALNGQLINEYQNFQTFWIALQTLIGFSTGENWDNFLWEVYKTAPSTNPACQSREFNDTMCGFTDRDDCIPLDGCGSWMILPFMYSFFLLLGYIGINLFSGIVVDAIGDSSATCPVNGHTLAEFVDSWARFDPHATGLITAEQLVDLLLALPPPFGFHGTGITSRRRVVSIIGDMNIPVYDDEFVHFKDVPRALVQWIMSEGQLEKMREISRVMDELGVSKQFDDLWRKNRGNKQINDLRTRSLTSSNVYTAKMVVARFIRRYRERKLSSTNVVLNPPIELQERIAEEPELIPENVQEKKVYSTPPPTAGTSRIVPLNQFVADGKAIHLPPIQRTIPENLPLPETNPG